MRLFGTTISETYRALAPRVEEPQDVLGWSSAILRLIFSAIMVAAGIYLIWMNQGESATVGGSLLGTVAGYWLR